MAAAQKNERRQKTWQALSEHILWRRSCQIHRRPPGAASMTVRYSAAAGPSGAVSKASSLLRRGVEAPDQARLAVVVVEDVHVFHREARALAAFQQRDQLLSGPHGRGF